MIYTNDPQAIRDAQKDVDDAKLEIQKQSIQDQIDALDDEIDRYNDLIDQINNAADNQIDALEKIKNKWQEVIDQQEYAKNVSLLTGEFGTNAISKILTGNDDDLLAQWKDSYINTLAGIDMESQGYIGNMTQQIASLYGVDLSPLQNQFTGVKESVNGMTDALSAAANAVGIGNVSGDTSNPATQDNMPASSTGTETSLENAIKSETDTAMNAFDQHTDKLTNEVTPAIQTAAQEMDTFNETAGANIEKTVTIHYETTGGTESASNIAVKKARVGKVFAGKAFAEDTTGKAFADGNDGLSHDEKNALRSEYGQPELTVYPDGNYEITTEPVISDLPKGTTVYNEEQTREIMSKKPQADGNIGAVVGNDVIKPNGDTLKPDGTVIKSNGVTIKPDGTIITPEGEVYEPLRPGDRMYDMLQKFQNYFNGIESRGETMYNSALVDHQKQMEQMINQITTANVITNNNKPNVTIGDIHVTCPGVTEQQVAERLGGVVQKELNRKFSGLHNYADQVSRIR